MDQTIPPKPSSGSGMTMYFVMFIITVVLAICVYQFIAKPIMDDQAKKEKEKKDAEAAEKSAIAAAEAKRIADAIEKKKIADAEAYANKYSYLPTMYNPGSDLSGGVGGSVESCRVSCDTTPGCVAFNISTDLQTCSLKSSVLSPIPNTASNYYYNPPVKRTYTMASNTDVGNDIYNGYSLRTPDECKKVCDVTNSCKGFSTNKEGTKCYLKANVSDSSVRVNNDGNLYTASA